MQHTALPERSATQSPIVWPRIIQGGMGAGISGWKLARTVAMAGHLGVVSGTGLDMLLARRLEDGDPGGHLRRALAAFPVPGIADRILARYFRAEGRPPHSPYRRIPRLQPESSAERQQLYIVGAFAEVYLAREGHEGAIGINLLTKIQLPTYPLLYGAMLAGVKYVLMGAGIPREVPGALDRLAAHEAVRLRLDVVGARAGEVAEVPFDPALHGGAGLAPLERPRFLAIVSSHSLATLLARKATGRVDGFVIEAPVAGGHNAPPRGGVRCTEQGEPIYGERDAVDLEAMRALGRPFWLAGGTGTPAGLTAALAEGAEGIQVGTLFAFCEESGLAPDLRREVLDLARADDLEVFTDPQASPTGYPFKILRSRSTPWVAPTRERICDLGALRTAYRKPGGGVGFRCPGEPVEAYVAKGGDEADTPGRQCLCNALLANVGYPQVRPDGSVEPPLLTAGDQAMVLGEFLGERRSYTAADVLAYLLGDAPAGPAGGSRLP